MVCIWSCDGQMAFYLYLILQRELRAACPALLATGGNWRWWLSTGRTTQCPSSDTLSEPVTPIIVCHSSTLGARRNWLDVPQSPVIKKNSDRFASLCPCHAMPCHHLVPNQLTTHGSWPSSSLQSTRHIPWPRRIPKSWQDPSPMCVPCTTIKNVSDS
jgi:hypothetical protein